MSSIDESIPRIPIGEWAESGVDWLTDNAEPVFDAFETVINTLNDTIMEGLLALPAVVMALIFGLLALASPELEVLGITAVAGNVPLALTQKNARIVCELAGRPDMRVFAGCEAPMTRTLVTAEHVHGRTGLDGPTLPDPTMPLDAMHAVDFIIQTLRAALFPGRLCLCRVARQVPHHGVQLCQCHAKPIAHRAALSQVLPPT